MRKRRSREKNNPKRINDRIAVIFGGALLVCFILGSAYLLITGRSSEPHLTTRKTTGEISGISITEIEQVKDSMDSDEKQKVKDMLSPEQIQQIKQQLGH